MARKAASRERTVVLKRIHALASCGHLVEREDVPWINENYTRNYDVCATCFEERKLSTPADEEWVATVDRIIEKVEHESGRPFAPFAMVGLEDIEERMSPVKTVKKRKPRQLKIAV